jgi:hypothetical protein
MPGMVNTTIMVDSKTEKLNSFEIVHAAIEDAGDTETPLASQIAGIVAELHLPDAKVQQFGNTLFVAHVASKKEALVRAFNADTAANFITNMRDFCDYVYEDLGIDTIYIPGMEDEKLARLIQALFARPNRPDMGYKITEGEQPMAVAQLGPARN